MSTILSTLLLLVCSLAHAADPLPSWNEGASKKSIKAFVEQVTNQGGKHFVPVEQRIAVFDNDGTLLSEKPMYFQLAFALDRLKALAPEHPEWKDQQPFKAALEGDFATLSKGGEHALIELVMVTHAGITTGQFSQLVSDWLATARHPTTGMRYTDMVYQPMLELLSYLRDNGFRTYITSGGGIEFMRPWAEDVYGIPPEQVVGSSIVTEFEMRDGKPVLVDAGVETYTAKTFGADRYEIWTMQSAYHTLVPTVDGVQQAPGPMYAAQNVAYAADDLHARFSLDLARAYPAESNLDRWQRTVTLERSKCVEVEDQYQLS